jgi:ankyrin repeat protein
MANPRVPVNQVYSKKILDEHISDSAAISEILHLPEDLVVTSISQARTSRIVKAAINRASPALSRYADVALRALAHSAKLSLIKSMIKKDDKKDEDNLDHYATILSDYPNYPRMSLELLKLFFEAGLFDTNPWMLNSFLLRTIANHIMGGPLHPYAKFLIEMGANPNFRGVVAVNPDQLTLLHFALLNETDDLVYLMLRSDKVAIDYTLQDSKGRTVLVLAAKMRKADIFLLMLQDKNAQAALLIPDNENRNALHYGFLLGEISIINAVLSLGILNLDASDVYGFVASKLVFAPITEVIRVLNSVSIDERRYPTAVKNYFSLTEVMPLSLQVMEQYSRGLIVSKFENNGTLITEEMMSTTTRMVPILNCAQNANYVKQFRNRILALSVNQLPIEVTSMWQTESYYLEQLILSPKSLLETCHENRMLIAVSLTPPPSTIVPMPFFARSTTVAAAAAASATTATAAVVITSRK